MIAGKLYGLLVVILIHVISSWSSLLTGGQVRCLQDTSCYSCLCYPGGSCAPDGPLPGTIPAGAVCEDDSNCFSSLCVHSICAPDSSVPGKVAAGGFCITSEQCFSGYCFNRRCAPDSILQGKVAASGPCDRNEHCYSGNCMEGRCGADGAIAGVSPAGADCSSNGQCLSKVCIDGGCSPESAHIYGKVADGGRCFGHSNCENGVCYEKVCTRPAEEGRNFKHGYPGGVCEGNQDCHIWCIRGRCATPGRWDPKLVADGGVCDEHEQCQSGNCHNGVCSVSHYDRSIFPSIAAGSPCRENSDQSCWSGLCVNGRCSAETIWTPGNETVRSRRKKMVAAGGQCRKDDDCESGYCDQTICGPSGPVRGKVASGGLCTLNSHCFSGYCYKRRCAASGDTEGKVAPGGPCAKNSSCPSGGTCVNQHCVTGHSLNIRPTFQSADLHGDCWSNAQCKVGRCVNRKCSLPSFTSSAGSTFLAFRFIVFEIVALFVITGNA